MRGKDYNALQAKLDAGITPAYAGKSHQLVNYIIDSKDHPRLCGEKLFQ